MTTTTTTTPLNAESESVAEESIPQILTRSSVLPSLSTLDAGDVIECYAITRMAKLKTTMPFPKLPSNSTDYISGGSSITIRKSALAFRYKPKSTSSLKSPFTITMEYGPQRTGATQSMESMPFVTGGSTRRLSPPWRHHGHFDRSPEDAQHGGTSRTLDISQQQGDNTDEDESKYLSWENEAKIYYTSSLHNTPYSQKNPNSPIVWNSAYYMAPLTGAVFSKIIDFITEYPVQHPRYQPFQVVLSSPPSSDSSPSAAGRDKTVVLKSSNSEDFVWSVIDKLVDLYVDIEPILAPRRTGVQFLVSSYSDVERLSGHSVIPTARYSKGDETSGDGAEKKNVASQAADFYEKFYACASAIRSGNYSEFVSTSSSSFHAPTGAPSALPTLKPSIAANDDKGIDDKGALEEIEEQPLNTTVTGNDKEVGQGDNAANKTSGAIKGKKPNNNAQDYESSLNHTAIDIIEEVGKDKYNKTTGTDDDSSLARKTKDGLNKDGTGNETVGPDYRDFDSLNEKENKRKGKMRRTLEMPQFISQSKGLAYTVPQINDTKLTVTISEPKMHNKRLTSETINTTEAVHPILDTALGGNDEINVKSSGSLAIDESDYSNPIKNNTSSGNSNTTNSPITAPTLPFLPIPDTPEKPADEAKNAAEAAEKAAEEAKEFANSPADTKAAEAAAVAASAAKKAAEVTSTAAAQTAIDGLLSGDGGLMTSVLSTCFSDPIYNIRQDRIIEVSSPTDAPRENVDNNIDAEVPPRPTTIRTTTTYAYIYIDGANYYRLNLTPPYWEAVVIPQPVPLPQSLPGGRGDFVDWILALAIIGGFTVGMLIMLHIIGVFSFNRRLRLRWFFHPCHPDEDEDIFGKYKSTDRLQSWDEEEGNESEYDDFDNEGGYLDDDEVSGGGRDLSHRFGANAIPPSMGGRPNALTPRVKTRRRTHGYGRNTRSRSSSPDFPISSTAAPAIGCLTEKVNSSGVVLELGNMSGKKSFGRSNSRVNGKGYNRQNSETGAAGGGGLSSAKMRSMQSSDDSDTTDFINEVSTTMSELTIETSNANLGMYNNNNGSIVVNNGDSAILADKMRMIRDRNLVDFPHLKSRSKVAIPVSMMQQTFVETTTTTTTTNVEGNSVVPPYHGAEATTDSNDIAMNLRLV